LLKRSNDSNINIVQTQLDPVNIVSEWLLFNADAANFQLYYGENKLIFNKNNDEVRFVLDLHAEFDFYSDSPLKQRSTGRHVAPLGYIIRIQANQFLLFLLNATCLAEKQQIPILKSLV
jgi:hypothetical protein